MCPSAHKKKAGVLIVSCSLGLLLFLNGCQRLGLKPSPPPFTPKETAWILTRAEEQQSRVETFYSSGRLVAGRHFSKSESSILAVGDRNPFQIKVEITHPWGQPLFHILVREGDVRILSFPEKRLYVGRLGDPGLSKFLPGFIDAEQLWGVLRGFPQFLNHKTAVSHRGDQITLLNGEGLPVQSIEFPSGTFLPRLVSYTGQEMKVSFSDFQEAEGLYYAREIHLDDFGLGASMDLHYNQVVFNRSIPPAIFKLETPPGYTVFPLESPSKN